MQSNITTDLQNLFSYAFIERVPYHFVVPKKNNYLELSITERQNYCVKCGSTFVTEFKNDTNVYITKDKLSKQESVYNNLGLEWHKPNKGEKYIYRQSGLCTSCFNQESDNMPKEQEIYEMAKNIYDQDVALINDAKELMEEIIKKWIFGIETIEDLKTLNLNNYLDIRNFILTLCSNDFALSELLNNYKSNIELKIGLLQTQLKSLHTDKLNLFVNIDNSIYESMSDEIYNEYTVLMPQPNSTGEFYYKLVISVERIKLFLEQNRVENVFDLINEVGFYDTWIEWLLEHISDLNK